MLADEKRSGHCAACHLDESGVVSVDNKPLVKGLQLR